MAVFGFFQRLPLLLRTFLGLLCLSSGSIGFLWWYLLPVDTEWTEIYRGVYYLSKYADDKKNGLNGQFVAVRVDLSNPAVRVLTRQMDAEAEKEGGHYLLTFPDREVYARDLAVLISTTPFSGCPRNTAGDVNTVGQGGEKRPFRGYEGYPGRIIWSTEPVVSEGVATHVPKRCKLLWFNGTNRAHVARDLTSARFAEMLNGGDMRYAVGFEILHVAEGEVIPTYRRIKFKRNRILRPFIGIDAEGRFLYLMAFESASIYGMAKTAVELGVYVGGQMDAGNTTWLVVGKNPRGVRPFTGIRGGRPIGAYLAVKSRALSKG